MNTLEGADFYGQTIFCDDARHELGGKISLIGIYTERMYVHGDFPFLLPKFALYVTCVQRHRALKHISKFAVFLPGDEDDGKPSIESNYGESQFAEALDKAKKEPTKHGVFQASAVIALTPLVIPQAGFIRVRAVRDDEQMIRCGIMQVEQHPEFLAQKQHAEAADQK